MLKRAMDYSHQLLKEVVTTGDKVVDATVGNGGDTVLLATLVGDSGVVYGFDIQKQAIETTKQKLLLTGLSQQVQLFQQGHETVADVLPKNEEISAAIFNLGYLPQSDKSIITKGETTLIAIQSLLPHLRKGGRLILVVYYGHDGGLTEKEAVLEYVTTLPQEECNVLRYEFINQKNDPPFVIAIEKK
ncbi:16S rRNA (cytosine(1402)-N(4))-methyltransferase [Carnobacterium divergens]|uniref:tRNA (mnm(5)s(2)U34)-methyltransferase n=1 Tax=Carnobacterium divergens TaxID=2748 RepID=UPI001072E5ED|nr:class I SAM-dependent methyltransferase [Carnobacterium divergens]TFJ43895.1 16S rRNA (cytosine(1402)-N(4))-methyltransferase [Carnobacterium divergens]TFJ52024.1 16S rRNA (cytosine(1402)-N(4))-methyltransferase [Carnobacterium divergens]TFJ56604.1 16S rRNA (cytosine(1402)-N(4))-methyltransferase [Carnobacterium divergens]TFJ64617.1 16S rRNA (cytosine(1402)-N(4))-methyltransferase [Carnobacterium divergens]TFJ73619.1 16S rRNA (cytosine(1402)-N(4))-methyltransferase [Carnobacterium divergens